MACQKACDNFPLTISTKKPEVVHQPAPGKPYNEPTTTVNGQKLQVVDKFTYLGSTLSRAVHIDDEVSQNCEGQRSIRQTSHKCLGTKWNQT